MKKNALYTKKVSVDIKFGAQPNKRKYWAENKQMNNHFDLLNELPLSNFKVWRRPECGPKDPSELLL